MIVYGEYALATLRSEWETGLRKVTLEGFTAKLTSHRLQLFFTKGEVCVRCGLEGEFFRLETHAEGIPPHLNLYGSKNGKVILFTKDHIIPKSKGGANSMENYQTMCAPCNGKKADKLEV